jgi:hypothetical protein
LLWTTSPAHYPHVAISRGHEVDCRTVAPLFLLKETEMNVPHDREERTHEQKPISGFIKAREDHEKGVGGMKTENKRGNPRKK